MSATSETIQFLLEDHKRLRGLFRQFETIDTLAPTFKADVCREILMEIEVHTWIEEKFLFPTLASAFQEENDKALIADCYSDHEAIKKSLHDLRWLSVRDARYNAKFNEMILEFEQHLAREETEVFQRVHSNPQAFSATRYLADPMREERERLKKLPRYLYARPEIVQNMHGGEQKRTAS